MLWTLVVFWCIQLSVCQTCVNRDQQIMDPLSSMMMPHSRTQRDLDPFRWGTQQWQDPWQMQPYGFRDPSFQSLLDTQRKQMRAWNPVLDADIVEKVDGSFVLHSDLPGVDPKDLDITIDGNQLIIKAERAQVKPLESDTIHRMERTFGQVQRTLTLPPNCDGDKAEVKFVQGVLEITFPKKADTATRKKLAIKQ